MLPTVYKRFLKRLQDRGIHFYIWFPTGGCGDVGIKEVELYLENPEKFYQSIEEEETKAVINRV